MVDASALPGVICVSEPVGTFTLNAIDINFSLAWGIPDLSALTMQAPPVKGSNRNLPGTRGSRPLQHFAGEKTVTLPFLVSGVVDKDEVPTVIGEEAELDANVRYLMDNVFDPALGVTIPAVLRGTLNADVQVLGFDPVTKDAGFLAATLSLLIPYGGFV